MLCVADEVFLPTPLGPRQAGELKAGDTVICLFNGQPVCLEVAEKTIAQNRELGWLICSEAGDVVVSERTSLVTSRGLMTAAAVRDLVANGNIGRMTPGVVSLENPLLAGPGTGGSHSQLLGETIARIWRECCVVPSGNSALYRVGAHDGAVLRDVATNLVGSECEVIQGPVGWAWLRPLDSPLNRGRIRRFQDLLSAWQPTSVAGRYQLPVEAEKLRWLTIAALTQLGIPRKMNYAPRYCVKRVELEIRDTPAAFGKVLTVNKSYSRKMSSIRFARAGAYAIVGGALCPA